MENNSEVVYLYLDDIIPNRFQPREVFNEQALKELAVSIREHGVIQPIIVRKVENKYEIIAGERRYKASTMAGLTKIPAIVKNLDDKESSKVALIENLQRKDLSPIEEARTYQKILELEDSMTQEQLAATIGKTQSSVSNKLRLLVLPDEIQDALLKEKISERHARSLLNIKDKNEQIKMMDKIITEKMTVRELDKEIKEMQEKDNSGNEIASINPITTMGMDTHNNLTENSTEETEKTGENMENTEINNTNIDNQNTNSLDTTVIDTSPTSVDINKIRENSQDIMQTSPTAGVSDLMKSENSEDNSFKFVPSFGVPEQANVSNIEPTTAPTETNILNQFFDPNLNVNSNIEEKNTDVNLSSNLASTVEPLEDNNSIPSSISFTPLTIQPSNIAIDVGKAVNDVKNTITNLENEGYKISFEENDNDNNYKITIEIQKQ